MSVSKSEVKHTPLKLAGDGRIETADGWAIGLNWFVSGPDPYAAARAFAPYIVRAVNRHDDLISTLKAIAEFGGNLSDEAIENVAGENEGRSRGIMYAAARALARAAIARAEGTR